MKPLARTDTIAAIATPAGRGGVGIIRLSGPKALEFALRMTDPGRPLQARQAHFRRFHDAAGEVLDEGIALYFPGPNSFTGEDVVELQGHGGPVLMDMLLKRTLELGARMAQPGEFSQRAFLNDKLDLAQAEAIADLIDASSQAAVKSATRSLQGAFSQRIQVLLDSLIKLRLYVEAAIDFPDEEIDFLSDGVVAGRLQAVMANLDRVMQEARQGSLLREGVRVVIAGKPNAGKSSLLNALAGYEAAIVTDIAGTTRDVLREQIHLDGLPLHIIDTAGLRETEDRVEQEGIRRAYREMGQADGILLVYDLSTELSTGEIPLALAQRFFDPLPPPDKLCFVANKADLAGEPVSVGEAGGYRHITLSARNGEGMGLLRDHLKALVGYQDAEHSPFIARRRHLDALQRTREALQAADAQLHGAALGELMAEDLRAAQQALGEITGEFSADDLLGKIFGSFCIGK
ncbi:tRNA modification GTPase trmE [Fluviicoccus keumensis]|uniref:tRNA modification GTPase MnmE n=1 Tax=Fluviicoccus keumensis TaxID=1435465 RepID=A0A4Q7ZDF4_9GAMM|nr:tRNA uridine-5-carboxymethylaminomethyl(34) synthesis GTPase MnmE [Fluviicoccus keumensis]RZU48055.1 tRNA modification GTPase trmE [Fluviicoccus keumensis]